MHPSCALFFGMAALLSCGGAPQPSARHERGTVTDTPAVKYAKVFPSNELGFARVASGEGATYAEGIIDAHGVEIIAPRTSVLVNDITGSTALVQNGRIFQFVDLSKGPVDTAMFSKAWGFEYAEPYRCGLALVKLDDRWFHIDPVGNNRFGTTFDFAESFHNDRAMVMEQDHYRIIDTAGRTVAHMRYDQVSPQSPWCWQVTRIKGDAYWSGFVDLNGKEITPLIYDEVGYYDPEVKRIRVGRGEKYGFLDERANEVIKVRYERAEIFNHGKARVMLDGREFYIDPDGRELPD